MIFSRALPFARHEADHGELHDCEFGARQVFEVPREAAAAAKPAERPLDNPAFGQDHEALGRIRALDDFEPSLPMRLAAARVLSPL